MTLPTEVVSYFETVALTLNELQTELTRLEEKYGSQSTLVHLKRRQLAALFSFYETMATNFPKLYKGLRMAAVNQEALYIIEAKRTLGVSWDTAVELIGIPKERIKDLKTIDDLLERIAFPITEPRIEQPS